MGPLLAAALLMWSGADPSAAGSASHGGVFSQTVRPTDARAGDAARSAGHGDALNATHGPGVRTAGAATGADPTGVALPAIVAGRISTPDVTIFFTARARGSASVALPQIDAARDAFQRLLGRSWP